MTDYTLFGSTIPAGSSSFTGSNSCDVSLQIKANSACTFKGYRWWVPSGGDTVGSNRTFRLYQMTSGTTGTLIAAGTITGSGTWGTEVWSETRLSTPVTLVSGQSYLLLASCVNDSRRFIHSWWASGGGSSGVTSGPMTAPSQAAALGSQQQLFVSPSTGNFPTNTSDGEWFGFDVIVSDAVPYAAYACNEGSGTTIIDYSGNSRNITLTGSNTWPAGHGSYAASFKAGTSGSDGGSWDGGAALPALSGDVSTMTWHLTTAGATTISFASGLYSAPGTARLAMFSYRSLNATAAAPQLTVRDSASNLYSMGVNSTTADTAWHHVAAVYHAAGGVDLYVDGVFQATYATGGNAIGTQVRYIATGSSFSNTGAQSQIQDYRVFAAALTASDVTFFMNTPVVNTVTPSGLLLVGIV